MCMEFPNDIKKYILSYLPYPYKKPAHFSAIQTSKKYRIHIYKKPTHLDGFKRSHLLIDFKFNRLFFIDREEDIEKSIHFIWIDSVNEFKKFVKMVRTGEINRNFLL